MDERLKVVYQLTCAAGETPRRKARGVALEQTVELPNDALPYDIRERMVGLVDEVVPLGGRRHQAVISYPLEAIAGEIGQFLNLLFGNISLKRGILITGIQWPRRLLAVFGGPRYGIDGLRALTGVQDRALLCTALKPMGCTTAQLAARAREFALGGIDLIKDDHGLSNQGDAPFRERLLRCQEAVHNANAESAGNSLYLPNVTAGYDEFPARLATAREAGCRAVLINPWVMGLDAMRWARDEFGLAIMAHPSLTGVYFGRSHGLRPELLLGDIFRATGADGSIYPNAGGRFGFSIRTCEAINGHLRGELGGLRPAMPVPGGGMDVGQAASWVRRYGVDTILLIGGSLYLKGDLRAASAALLKAVEAEADGAQP